MTVASIAAVSSITYWDVERIVTNARWIRHGHEVLVSVETIEILLDESESSQRGYLITSDPKYLDRMKLAVLDLPAVIDRMLELTRRDAGQQARIKVLRSRSEAKIEEMERVLEEFRREGFEKARQIVKEDHGFELMKECRALTREFRAEESRLIKSRSRIVSKTFDRLIVELWALKILFLVMIYFMVRKAFSDKFRLDHVPVMTLPVVPELVLSERH